MHLFKCRWTLKSTDCPFTLWENFLNKWPHIISMATICFSVHFGIIIFLGFLVIVLCKWPSETLSLAAVMWNNSRSLSRNSCFNCCKFGLVSFFASYSTPGVLWPEVLYNKLVKIEIVVCSLFESIFGKKIVNDENVLMIDISFTKFVHTRMQALLFLLHSRKTQIISWTFE